MGFGDYFTSDMDLTLVTENGHKKYWKFTPIKSSQRMDNIPDDLNLFNTEYLSMFVLSSYVVSGLITSAMMNISVIGLYATVVLAIGRFVRMNFERMSQRVIYEEMCEVEDIFEFVEN